MKKHIGSSFEAFLEEKGIKADVELRAQKEILAEQIREAMERKGVSFSALASSMERAVRWSIGSLIQATQG
jgi:hypothetical protein